jgi:hypothetical protein
MYCPSSESSTLPMVRDGVLTVPPEYLLLELMVRAVGTPLMTFCHTIAVSLGSEVTTQLITTELPTVTDGTILAVTLGTSEIKKNTEVISIYLIRITAVELMHCTVSSSCNEIL